MKTPLILAFAVSIAGLSIAQEVPPAPPAALAETAAPAAPGETAAPAPPDKAKVSAALAQFFVTRDKQAGASVPDAPRKNSAEFLAGVQDVLSKSKSLDYAAGAAIATQIIRSEVEIDTDAFLSVLKDGLEGKEGKLSPQEVQEVMQQVQTGLQVRMEAKRQAAAAAVLKKTEEFLAGNAKSDGVQVTGSGLQYKLEKQGEGAVPAAGKLAILNFKVYTMDGKEVEKSPESGPARKAFLTLPKGIQEGLALIKAGGKAQFWLPPALAYGESGRPPLIPGNTVIRYEAELVGVEDGPKPRPEGAPEPISATTPPISVEIPQTNKAPAPASAPVPAPDAAPAPAPEPPK